MVLEKIKDGQTRDSFLQARRSLRGRPDANRGYYRRKRKYKGDLKSTEAISGLEMNDYDVISLHIPYGPGWDARRIDKLVYQTDLGMNCERRTFIVMISCSLALQLLSIPKIKEGDFIAMPLSLEQSMNV